MHLYVLHALRQADFKTRAPGGVIEYTDGTAVAGNGFVNHRKAQPGTALGRLLATGLGARRLPEGLEDERLLVGRHAGAVVSDGNAEMRRLIDQCHFDAAVDGTVADSVLHQVGEGAAQQVGVAAQDGRVHRVEGQADLLGVGREPGQVDHFGEQVVEVVLLGLDGLDRRHARHRRWWCAASG